MLLLGLLAVVVTGWVGALVIRDLAHALGASAWSRHAFSRQELERVGWDDSADGHLRFDSVSTAPTLPPIKLGLAWRYLRLKAVVQAASELPYERILRENDQRRRELFARQDG
jgi:hypothetical protein